MCCGILRQILSKTKCNIMQRAAAEKRREQIRSLSTISTYEVFCDAISEKGFVWTLIESFSFRNNNEFADKAFYKQYPVNQDAFSWNKFRLSWPLMNAMANRSTHVRATCNFNSEELKYSD